MQYASTYNLFRSLHDCTVICAVPQDRPVPLFIQATAWKYDNTVWDTGVVPQGFLTDAARSSGDLDGFYLFYLGGRIMPSARETRARQAERLATVDRHHSRSGADCVRSLNASARSRILGDQFIDEGPKLRVVSVVDLTPASSGAGRRHNGLHAFADA